MVYADVIVMFSFTCVFQKLFVSFHPLVLFPPLEVVYLLKLGKGKSISVETLHTYLYNTDTSFWGKVHEWLKLQF